MLAYVLGNDARRPAAQGARGDAEGVRDLRVRLQPARAGAVVPGRRGAAGEASRGREERRSSTRSTRSRRRRFRRKSWSARRTKALKDFELALNQSEVVGLQISEWIAKGDWRLFFLNRDRIRKVTAEDVQRVALRYLKVSNRTLGEFLPTAKPDRAEVPQAPEASALLQGYTGDKAIAAGEVFDPSPANVEARTQRSTLPGGLKLALVPKKTRGGTVVASLSLHFGTEASLRGKRAASDLAVDMLTRGTAVHTRQQFADELDKLKARLSISADLDTVHARIETVRESLPGALKLLAEALRQPTFPADQFEQLRQENLAALEQEKSEPQAMAGRAIRPTPGAVREGGRALRAHAGRAHRRVQGGDGRGGEGSSTPTSSALRTASWRWSATSTRRKRPSLVRWLLDGWAAPKPYARIEHPFQNVPAGTEKLEAPDKANAVLLAGMNLVAERRGSRLPGARPRQLHARRRLPQLAARGAHPPEGRPELRRRLAALGRARSTPRAASTSSRSTRRRTRGSWRKRCGRRSRARSREASRSRRSRRRSPAGCRAGRCSARTTRRSRARSLASSISAGRSSGTRTVEKKVGALTPGPDPGRLRRHLDPAKLTVVRAAISRRRRLRRDAHVP